MCSATEEWHTDVPFSEQRTQNSMLQRWGQRMRREPSDRRRRLTKLPLELLGEPAGTDEAELIGDVDDAGALPS